MQGLILWVAPCSNGGAGSCQTRPCRGCPCKLQLLFAWVCAALVAAASSFYSAAGPEHALICSWQAPSCAAALLGSSSHSQGGGEVTAAQVSCPAVRLPDESGVQSYIFSFSLMAQQPWKHEPMLPTGHRGQPLLRFVQDWAAQDTYRIACLNSCCCSTNPTCGTDCPLLLAPDSCPCHSICR